MKDIFDPIRAILNGKAPTAAKLGDAAAKAREVHEAAKVKAGQERLLHPKHLLAGAAQAAAHEALMRELDSQVTNAALILAETERRHAEAAAAEAEAAKAAKYEAAAQLSAEVQKELRAKYPELAAGLLQLLHRVAYADDAIRAANEDLPAGRARLELVEAAVRDAADLPRENLRERVVALWAFPDSNEPLSEDQQARVSGGPHQGHLRSEPNAFQPTSWPVVKKRFRRIEYLEPVNGRTGDRLADMKLPALRARDPDLWTPGEIYRLSHADTLRRLNEVISGARTLRASERPVKVEYVVTEDPVDAEAN